jgi:predicted RNase H-like nuclease (RuvC/YqgF family)
VVVRDENGEIYTVRYDAVDSMLLNEFLKEHVNVEEQNCRIQQQEATIAELKNEMKALVARIEEQDARIEKVSHQNEMSSSASQIAAND